jgi:ABC-2 type transport system ATP-binding protein
LINVRGLSKSYGGARPGRDRPALDDVSFEVGKGEVVGLLGPNGAGKSTIMRILTCFLRPTRGEAVLAGCSIGDDPRGVRRAIGYLPEAVPLPPEMRVDEYLLYRAALKGVARGLRGKAVGDAVAQAGLGDRRRQIIGTLSRGYRQRVGLADALLASPPILILDEPTVGLDPNQIRETRSLIRDLGRERTVLLSTHLLPEVEAIAGRVIILHAGRVVAAHSPEDLRKRMGGARRIRVELPASELDRGAAILGKVAGVSRVERADETHLALHAEVAGDDGELRAGVFRAAAEAGLTLRELRAEAPSLEELFARVTS